MTDQEFAESMIYAYLNPKTFDLEFDLLNNDNFWDGVCNLKGRIRQVQVDEDASRTGRPLGREI